MAWYYCLIAFGHPNGTSRLSPVQAQAIGAKTTGYKGQLSVGEKTNEETNRPKYNHANIQIQ